MNTIFLGWDRPQSGKEGRAIEHFGEFLQFLGTQQKQGTIASFEPVLLAPHGGDLSGFVLIKGDPAKLAELQSSDAWQDHVTRGTAQMERFGVITAFTGDAIPAQMARYQKYV